MSRLRTLGNIAVILCETKIRGINITLAYEPGVFTVGVDFYIFFGVNVKSVKFIPLSLILNLGATVRQKVEQAIRIAVY